MNSSSHASSSSIFAKRSFRFGQNQPAFLTELPLPHTAEMIDITLSTNEPLGFETLLARAQKNYRGARLPGSQFFYARRESFVLYLQEFKSEHFIISCRYFQFHKQTTLRIHEQAKGLRLEWVMAGSLPVLWMNGSAMNLQAGKYHVTDTRDFQSTFQKGSECYYLTLHYYPDLAASLPSKERDRFKPGEALNQTPAMQAKVFGILQNTYRDDLLEFCYDNFLRDILLLHLVTETLVDPEGLTEAQKAAIMEADSLIATDVARHWTIPLLSRKAGMNEYTLKKGFAQLFSMGPFERLLYYRMQVACPLLEQTDKPLKDIAYQAGYRSQASFVTGFKRWFSISPGEWRRRSRGGEPLPQHPSKKIV